MRSVFACCVTASLGSATLWFAPVRATQLAPGHGSKPVSECVGDDPTSPTIVVPPELVLLGPASAVPASTNVNATASARSATARRPRHLLDLPLGWPRSVMVILLLRRR